MAFLENLLAPIGVVSAALIAGSLAFVGLITTKESKVSEFRQKWINDLRDEIAVFASCVDTLMEHIAKDNWRSMKDRSVMMQSKLGHSELYNKVEQSRISIILRINESEKDKSQRVTNKLFVRKINRISNTFERGDFVRTRELIKELVPLSKVILKHEWNRARDGEKWYLSAKTFAEWVIGSAATVIFAMLMCIVYESLTTAHSAQNIDQRKFGITVKVTPEPSEPHH